VKIKLLNVVYSPNLGDGLLVDCLRWGCSQYLESAEISSVDLAGRRDFGASNAARTSLLTTLSALPTPVRRSVAGAALRLKLHFRLREFYRRELAGADAIVVGGGHLFVDTDLNFPLKLAAALDVVAERNTPTWVYGCGVSSSWSPAGRKLFENAVRKPRLVSAFVRDELSQQAWNSQLTRSSGIEATVVRDPGLLCREAYGITERRARRPKAVGVGIIAPVAIRYHGGGSIHAELLTRWFGRLIGGLLRSGQSVRLVSNGSPEDTEYGNFLINNLASLPPDASIDFPQHSEPRGLVETVGSLSRFVGFRLHGLISAHSFGLPTYALTWDDKIQSFMSSIGRADQCFDVRITAPELVLQRMLADELPVNGNTARESLADIRQLCESIAARFCI
jgi:polysaccharide pyruvyl transferase WcaK-like protein